MTEDEVREQLKAKCRHMITCSHYNNLDDAEFDRQIAAILAIPELAIADREAELPTLVKYRRTIYNAYYTQNEIYRAGQIKGRLNMLKAGWRKVVTE